MKKPCDEFVCPGESVPISRAVHRGRLDRCYAACRNCRHGNDLEGFSVKKQERLRKVLGREAAAWLFGPEGAAGVYPNDIDAKVARRLAIALGGLLWDRRSDARQRPVVSLGGDGRSLTPEIVAAVGEGLRFVGCRVVDIGPVTSPCLAYSIDQHGYDGGLLVGNPTDRSHVVGLKFWARSSHGSVRPLSQGLGLEEIQRRFARGVDRPVRAQGSTRRVNARETYLATLAEQYHGLRPLRFVMSTNCRPFRRNVAELIGSGECQSIESHASGDALAASVSNADAHFGVHVSDDGQQCRVIDDLGHAVRSQRLLRLILRYVLPDTTNPAVVFGDEVSDAAVRAATDLGVRVTRCVERSAAIDFAMRTEDASLAVWSGGASLAYRLFGLTPTADALVTLTLLLNVLSESDRPLSEVLDAEGARP